MPVRTREKNLEIIASYDDALYGAATDEADVVMKGGITSGVVYPLAVCHLAQAYRFRNVGGSSAGAIAAAFAAAAEHNRDGGGFRKLARLPADLGTQLPAMFQPSRRTRPLFEVFRAFQNKTRGGPFRGVRLMRYALSRQPLASLAGAAAVTLVVLWCVMLAHGTPATADDWRFLALTLLPAAPLVLAGALAGSAAGTVRAAMRELPRNGHGLCIGSNGASPPGEGTLPFTDWLHARLAEVSGEPVLTFGHLWGGRARDAFGDAATKKDRDDAMRAFEPDVRLEMMTTNVSQRRPVRLPFVEAVYFFCDDELSRWFPPDVMAQMRTGGEATDRGVELYCPEHDTRLYRVPPPPDLPVIVATRMSLSFPGLISAVPLWVVEHSKDSHRLLRCWFSDGGISSNFPVHFFDSLLPRRRTFAISLGPYPPDRPDSHVYYRDPSLTGRPRTIPAETLGAFAAGILDTMQNWSDVAQAQLPGYRDRIVEVRQKPDEGGMNIDMPEDTILDLATRGRDAATEITRPRTGFDFDKHRERRFYTAMCELQVTVDRMRQNWSVRRPGLTPYEELVTATSVQRAQALFAFVAPPAGAIDFTTEPPRPRPELRMAARF